MNTIGLNEGHRNKCFKLMADIDLAEYEGEEFNIIGIPYSRPFTGVFDGNNHRISNFTYSSTGREYIGLFRYVEGERAEIRNLGLIDPNINAGTGYFVGALVGYLSEGTITNCCVKGGNVTGEHRVGGLVGGSGGTITYAYAAGIVEGDSRVGGLVGSNGGSIVNCYAAGPVTGTENTGGLAGSNLGGNTINSYWDIETSGQTVSAGGEGKTTAEMMTASTFFGGVFAKWYGRLTKGRTIPGSPGRKSLANLSLMHFHWRGRAILIAHIWFIPQRN